MPIDIQSVFTYSLPLLIGTIGWIAAHLVGKPYLEYRILRSEIAHCLILYANIPCPPQPVYQLDARTIEARSKYRDLASRLMSIANMIACYQVWSCFGFIIPKWEELETAKGNLIGLSNSIGEPNQSLEISKREDNIRRLLLIR